AGTGGMFGIWGDIFDPEYFENSVRVANTGALTIFWINAHCDYAVWLLRRPVGQAGQSLTHIVNPDRLRGRAAVFVAPQRCILVEAKPGHGYQRRAIACEPGVPGPIGGPGFTGQIRSFQYSGPIASASGNNVPHHGVDNIGNPFVDDSRS